MLGRVRFALMGCGAIARKHAESISKYVENADLVAFCDRDFDRAESYAQRYNARAFPSFDQMMQECGSEIDAICVLTPTGHHVANVCEVAAYGKHVIVEKPMALRSADAKVMVAACNAAGVGLFVVKQNRFNRPVQRLRQALTENRFGNLVMVTARVRWRRDEAYYKGDAWRGTSALDGGVMENQASHHIDLVQWLGGNVTSVYCIKVRRLAHIETEDTAIATLQFKSGAIGVIEATTAARPKDLEGSISVLGEGGTVEIGGFAANEIKTWQFVDPTSDDVETLDKYGNNPEGHPLYAHANYLQNVVDTLLGKDASPVNGEEGLKTVAILEAMRRSSETNMSVELGAP
jgi:UDP-N-acetyl-2-amino-2-deoxyglucuronate dehydrogenase